MFAIVCFIFFATVCWGKGFQKVFANIYGKSYSGKCRNRHVCSRLLVSSMAADLSDLSDLSLGPFRPFRPFTRTFQTFQTFHSDQRINKQTAADIYGKSYSRVTLGIGIACITRVAFGIPTRSSTAFSNFLFEASRAQRRPHGPDSAPAPVLAFRQSCRFHRFHGHSVWSTLLDLLSQSGARAVTIVTDMHGNNLQRKIEEAVSTNPTVQFSQFSSVSSVQSVVQ